LIYHGPDKKYEGTEICYGYNEDSLTIYNITDKTTTNIISKTLYDGATYTYQGWVLDTNNQAFLLTGDELHEVDKKGAASDQHATTLIWNITSREAYSFWYLEERRHRHRSQPIREELFFRTNPTTVLLAHY